MLTHNRFPEIIAELQIRSDLAARAVAEHIEDAAKTRVPVDTGRLQQAIHTERRRRGTWAVVAGDTDAWYGHIVEHGGAHTSPRPFLVPALESARDEALQAFRAALRGL
jgi:HK97 gp10 family phage protein